MPIPHTNFDQPRICSSAAGSAPTSSPSLPAPVTVPTAPRIGTGDFGSSTTRFIDDGQMTGFSRFLEHNNARAGRNYGEPRPRTPIRVNSFGDPNLFQATRESRQQENGPVLGLEPATNHFGQSPSLRRTNAFDDPDLFTVDKPLTQHLNRIIADARANNHRTWGMVTTQSHEEMRLNNADPHSPDSGLDFEVEILHGEGLIVL
jgi:hypothetical protein